MKKCNECNCDMIEDCFIKARPTYDVDVRKSIRISVYVPTGETGSFLGIPYNDGNQYEIKARVCPKCGKIELFADFNNV